MQQLVSQTGSLVERTVDSAGRTVNERTVGNALDLPLVRESRNAAGQTLRLVRDTAGNVIELTLDSAGSVVSTRLIRPNR